MPQVELMDEMVAQVVAAAIQMVVQVQLVKVMLVEILELMLVAAVAVENQEVEQVIVELQVAMEETVQHHLYQVLQ
jgi:hypothetical protein